VVSNAVENAFVVRFGEVDCMLVIANDLGDDSSAITKRMTAMVNENLKSSDSLKLISTRRVVELVG